MSPAHHPITGTGATEGPWIADAHNTQKQAGRTVGSVRAPGDICPLAVVVLGVEGMPEDPGRANLRLMAAAPDLRDALQSMVNLFGWGEEQDERTRLALTAARSALLRAQAVDTGEGR